MSTAWDEVKSLAEKLKLAQLGGITQVLSERVCVELIVNLQKMQMIEVYHTNDALYYLTKKEIIKEIWEELELNDGFIELITLQERINIDFSVLESICRSELQSHSDELFFVNRILLNKDYLRKQALLVLENLKVKGFLRLENLAARLGLTIEFLRKELLPLIGSFAIQIDNFLATELFVQRCQSGLRGHLLTLSTPVNVKLLRLFNIDAPPQIFIENIKTLCSLNEIDGELNGDIYMPNIFVRKRMELLSRQLESQHFILASELKKINLPEPSMMLKNFWPNQKHLALKSAVIHSNCINQIQELIESNDWTYIPDLLPIGLHLNEQDLDDLLFQFSSNSHLFFLNRKLWMKLDYFEKIKDHINSITVSSLSNMTQANFKLLETIFNKNETQNSKTSSRSSRSQSNKHTHLDNKSIFQNLVFKEISSLILSDISKNFFLPIESIYDDKSMIERLNEDIFLSFLKDLEPTIISITSTNFHNISATSTTTSANSCDKKNHLKIIQETFDYNYILFQLYCKAVNKMEFSDDKLLDELKTHLIRIEGKNIFSFLAGHLSATFNVDPIKDENNADLRKKFISGLPQDLREIAQTLNQFFLNEPPNFESFTKAIINLAHEMELKTPIHDESKEAIVIEKFSNNLVEIVMSPLAETDPSTCLLAVVRILIQKQLKLPFSASGKLVPKLLIWLKTKSECKDLPMIQSASQYVIELARAKDADKKRDIIEDWQLKPLPKLRHLISEL